MLQAGLDLLNKLPQEKHLRPSVCLASLPGPGCVSAGKTICFGLLASRARLLSGALHSAVSQRQADTREVSCSSQTGEIRGRSGPSRGSGCWAGWQPRTGAEREIIIIIIIMKYNNLIRIMGVYSSKKSLFCQRADNRK